MAQDRMIRASMRSSEKVNSWPIPLRYFWTQLWGYCDDYGRGRRDARLVWADLFPLDDDVSVKTVDRWMDALEQSGVIVVYEVGGKRYFECINWTEHQPLGYLRKTVIPDSSGNVPDNFGKVSKSLESSGQREGKGREVKEEGKALSAPALFCPKHPTGTTDPCRACGNLRRAAEAARVTPVAKPTVSGIVTPPACDEHGYPFPCKYCNPMEAAS